MKKIKAILVDDESSAREVLASLLSKFDTQIELVAQCEDVLQAVEAINEHKPDVVFLDIEMPNYAGYEIVKFFDKIDFDIVFITAYDQYALKAFEVSAIDYILKPIDLDRFKDAIDKLLQKMERRTSLQQLELMTKTLKNESVEQMVVLDKGYKHFIDIREIVCIEAQESYCKLYLSTSKIFLISKKLKYYENIFAENKLFFRTHKSWIINSTFLESYSKTKLEIKLANGLNAKLSRYKVTDFEELFQ
ncbi:MAG: two-component system LytT family response regulator [Planctomycetota bacterium]|jgi:two-component system LytT family response regulator